MCYKSCKLDSAATKGMNCCCQGKEALLEWHSESEGEQKAASSSPSANLQAPSSAPYWQSLTEPASEAENAVCNPRQDITKQNVKVGFEP